MRLTSLRSPLKNSRQLELAVLAGAVLSMVSGIVVARTVGPHGRGQVVLVTTWAQSLGWAGGLSIDKALIARRQQWSGSARADLTFMALFGGIGSVSAGLVTMLATDNLRFALAISAGVLGTVASDARAATLILNDRWGSYALFRILQP